MRLYIPRIGDVITLAQDWSFNLHQDYRNETLFVKLGVTPVIWNGSTVPHPNPNDWKCWRAHAFRDGKLPEHRVTLPKGTKLTIRRLYIKAGKALADYASVTFSIPANSPGKIRGKFWAKLDDVNTMEIE